MEFFVPKSSVGGGAWPVNVPLKGDLSAEKVPSSLPDQSQAGIVSKPQKTQEQAIEELQKVIDAIQGPKRVLEVSVHETTHAIMIKVLNEDTGELIREVPPEKTLDIAAKMMELAGLLVDKKV